MQILLLALYSVVFIFLLYRYISKRDHFFTLQQVSLAFIVKLILGIVYGWIFLKFYGGDDTWALHRWGIYEKNSLLSEPAEFFGDFLPEDSYKNNPHFIRWLSLYLSDLEYAIQAKSLAFINLLTGNRYYVNVVFISALTFLGQFWIYRLFGSAFPQSRRWLYFAIFFFLPAVFWISGIRTDAFLFFFLALLLYQFSKFIERINLMSSVGVVAGFIGMLIIRSAYALLIVPALLTWFLAYRKLIKPVLAAAIVYGICSVIFLLSFILPGSPIQSAIINRQQSFFGLHGKTVFRLDTLDNTPISFAKVLPQAIHNTAVRPYLWEATGLFQIASAFENLIMLALFMYVLFKSFERLRSAFRQPLIIALLGFAFSVYLLVGYTVPFPGAIVRYKAIPELLIVSILTGCVRTEFLRIKKI